MISVQINFLSPTFFGKNIFFLYNFSVCDYFWPTNAVRVLPRKSLHPSRGQMIGSYIIVSAVSVSTRTLVWKRQRPTFSVLSIFKSFL